jgi:hypothetical protein
MEGFDFNDVFPAAAAFRAAKSALIALENRFETERSEAMIGQIRLAQDRLEMARVQLRQATRS